MNAIVLFDGVCNLCNSSVQFIIARDTKAYFRFASLQSEVGKSLLASHHLSPDSIDTIVLVEKGNAFVRSAAALRIAQHLDGAWRWLSIFRVLPLPLRDALYNFVARNRYRWFGKEESCWLPTPDLRERFLS